MSDLIRFARSLEAIARSGLTYSQNPFDRGRFEAVREIAAELAASVTGEPSTEVAVRFAEEYGYGTPKIDMRGVLLSEGRVLLVREIGDTRWTLPGGWADVGESPRQAIEKEIREEAGISSRAARVLAVFDRDFRGRAVWPAHAYKVYVECTPGEGTPTGDGVETEAAAYFDPHELPELSVKTPAEHLASVLALAADPAAGAALD